MSISPWVILAICLSAAAIAGILALHFWRAHVDARRQQQEKDASADPEKALPVENQQQQQQMQQQQQPAYNKNYPPPPAGPAPVYQATPTTTTTRPAWPPHSTSSVDYYADSYRASQTTVVEEKHG